MKGDRTQRIFSVDGDRKKKKMRGLLPRGTRRWRTSEPCWRTFRVLRKKTQLIFYCSLVHLKMLWVTWEGGKQDSAAWKNTNVFYMTAFCRKRQSGRHSSPIIRSIFLAAEESTKIHRQKKNVLYENIQKKVYLVWFQKSARSTVILILSLWASTPWQAPQVLPSSTSLRENTNCKNSPPSPPQAHH